MSKSIPVLCVLAASLVAGQAHAGELQVPKEGEGVASWYGIGDHSANRTADGTPFNPHDPHIIAHRTLPFGTRLRITNPQNGRSIEVVVHDRGPYVYGRMFDLTYGGAEALGTLNVATRVRYEILN